MDSDDRKRYLFFSSNTTITCFVTPRVSYCTRTFCCGSHRPKIARKRISLSRKKAFFSHLYLSSSLKEERSSQVQRLGNHTKQVTEQSAILWVIEWIGLFLFGLIAISATITFYMVTRNRRLSLLLVVCGLLWSISMVTQRLQTRRLFLKQFLWQQDVEKDIWKLEDEIESGKSQLATLMSQLESLAKTCEWMERKQEERKEEWKQFLWEWKRLGEEWNESRVAVNTRLYQLDKWEERWKYFQSTLQELASNQWNEKSNWSKLSEQINGLLEKVTLVSSGSPSSVEDKGTLSSSIANGSNHVSAGIVPWNDSKKERYSHLYSFSRDEFEREEMLKQLDEEWIDAYWKERDLDDNISPLLLLESSKTLSRLPQQVSSDENEELEADLQHLLSKEEEERPLFNRQDEESYKKETLLLMEQIGVTNKSRLQPILHAALRRWERLSYLWTDDYEVFLQWGLTLLNRARYSTSEEQEQQDLIEAGRKLMKSSQMNTSDPRVWFNWGLSLCLRGSILKGEEACQLFEAACEKYEKATQLDGLSFVTRYNYGLCLYSLGTLLTGELAAEYLHRAVDHFEAALDLEPSDEKTRKYLQKCQRLLKQLGIVPSR
ncbi:hypothetical protein GpartN1_g7277.t1 [Galdieria partita]|uniref:Uncharacterized protein n=1 Tax=Galdieria partita TaxID=83374 RepID=A0A9C7Q3F0_9RHOD|nr:hypothetical protein GpartN1_g7277.t1 [Galdieria partita]